MSLAASLRGCNLASSFTARPHEVPTPPHTPQPSSSPWRARSQRTYNGYLAKDKKGGTFEHDSVIDGEHYLFSFFRKKHFF